jgi:hypothetical protein
VDIDKSKFTKKERWFDGTSVRKVRLYRTLIASELEPRFAAQAKRGAHCENRGEADATFRQK